MTNTRTRKNTFDWIPDNVKSLVDYIPLARGIGIMIAIGLAIVGLTLL